MAYFVALNPMPDTAPIPAEYPQLLEEIKEFRNRMQLLADLELIRSPHRWPRHPFLCFVHRSEMSETSSTLRRQGVMYDKYPNCIFSVNIYFIPMFGGKMTEEEFLSQKIEYESLEALLRDWEVD